jgi:monofunctional biosynthetic peptidoglycan transglycosylase
MSRTKRLLLRRVALASVALAVAVAAAGAWLWLTLPDPSPLARENPRTTALIEQRRAEARTAKRPFRPRQIWIPADRIPPVLVQAVLLSEDANFFGHEGIDWAAMRDAAEHDLKVGRFARGASTLTQQLAKNLWLGTEKSLWRKAKEAVLAAKLERALSKRRILALYLNVVELDDGVFGFEAGARHHLGTSAAALTPAQAVVLASMLPAPRRVDLARPSSWLRSRSRRLLDRMRDHRRLTAAEHQRASAELERILAGPMPTDDAAEPPPEEDEAGAAVDAPRDVKLVSAPGANLERDADRDRDADADRDLEPEPEPEPDLAPAPELAPAAAQNGGDVTGGQSATVPNEQAAPPHE